MKRKLVSVVLTIITIIGLTGVCFAKSSLEPTFDDVTRDDWFYKAVKFTYENDIIKGYNENTFAPNDNLTRGMMVTILYRMDGAEANDGISKFDDVDSKEWYAVPIKWAVENGIIHGYANTNNFGPNDNIIRQDLAGILGNYASYKEKYTASNNELTGFSDYKAVDEYALSSMKWAVSVGVITGNADGTLNPKGNATRAETAAMITKYCIKVAEYSTKRDKKDVFQMCLNLESARYNGPYTILETLRFPRSSYDVNNSTSAKKDGFRRTNVQYNTFKEAMLEYMTEECYQEQWSEYFEDEDGYLCCSNSGASGVIYRVNSIIEVKDGYSANVTASGEGPDNELIINFKMDDNKNVVNHYEFTN